MEAGKEYGTFGVFDNTYNSSDEEFTVFSRNTPADYDINCDFRSEATLELTSEDGSEDTDISGDDEIPIEPGPSQDHIQMLTWTFTYSEDNQVYTIGYPCETSITPEIIKKIKKFVIKQAEKRFGTDSIVHKNETSSYTITKQSTYIMNGVTYDSIASMINKSILNIETMCGIIIRTR